ncbi:MAG TPA: hypothetical protein VMZ30_18545 [Pyrinomonadaceae bacterium]|nr:hypothetical protein [Pyrinomonadaceae bacterium]
MLTLNTSQFEAAENLRGERGAALITVLFISLLVLTLASALILTTGMSATNAVSSTDEIQAYYAAEAGTQAALNVLRGNVAPTINFKSAVANPDLSQWLTKNYGTPNPDRITLGQTANGMAYKISEVSDPDLSTKVTYSTSGSFTVDGNTSTSACFGGGCSVSLSYTPQSSTDITTNTNPTLGTFAFSGVKTPTNITIPAGTTFTLQITETAPLALGSSSPISVSIKGVLAGVINLSTPSVTLTFNSASIELPNVGTLFTLPTSVSIPVTDGTSATMPTIVTTPEPRRLIVKVEGYGPRGAIKNMQTMVSSFGINYDPPATFLIRGHDDSTTPANISIGSSAKYVYSGIDNAHANPLPAFLVTNNPDYMTLTTLKNNNDLPLVGDSTGLIPVLKALTLPTDLQQLPSWLQTTSDPISGARAFVQQLRDAAKQQFYKCSTARAYSCDRYFDTRNGEAGPSDFGAETDAPANGLFTFVDGDATLPNDGGKGLLIVTGTLNISGSKAFDGLVLVLGDGVINRTGGGNGTNFGAFVVARFLSSGGFLNPTFISSGSGTSGLQLDRASVRRGLRLGGVFALAVSEY